MTIFRFAFSYLFLLFAAYIAVLNWMGLFANLSNYKKGIDRFISPMPMLSIVSAALAAFISPHQKTWWMFLVPLFDYGNYILLYLPVVFFREFRATKKKK